MPKEFKSIEEQIELLSSRGLKISNKDLFSIFLFENNYYRISGYTLTLRKNDIFYRDSTSQNIIDIYEFDSSFRNLLLKYLEKIEVKIKSVYAYCFAMKYGPTNYLNEGLFSNKSVHC